MCFQPSVIFKYLPFAFGSQRHKYMASHWHETNAFYYSKSVINNPISALKAYPSPPSIFSSVVCNSTLYIYTLINWDSFA
ncbi:hypothetical protein V6N13_012099 [Hibiscus sabdariffa]